MPALQQILPSTPSALRAVLGLLTIATACLAVRCLYFLFWHPLAKFPGPRLAGVSSLWEKMSLAGGKQAMLMVEMHRKYGDIVRIGPNALSFTTVEAYHDIYGHVRPDKKRFLKTAQYERPEPRITSVRDPVEHGVQRRALAHAFSARALRDQEDVVHLYLDQLVAQLGKLGENGRKAVNVSAAYGRLTFDIIGDLSFGEPFGATANASDEWEHGILYCALYAGLEATKKHEPWLRVALPLLWGAKLPVMRAAAAKFKHMAREKALRRLAKGAGASERHDFISHLIKKGEVTAAYLMGNAQMLLVAGSETTATALTNTTVHLLQHPACLAALQHEVRGAFAAPADVTGAAAAACPYLHGVVEESLRLSPPVAAGLPRECPGARIAGAWVPAGAEVSCANYALARHPRYWQAPEAFRPERWLGAGLPGDDKRAFQTFSTGPRACIGMNLAYLELHVTLAKLVLAYDWELVTKGIDDWNSACKIFGLWEKPALMVKFHPRN